MVRSVTTEHFYCDICDSKYETEDQAMECENKPVEDLPQWAAVGKEVVGFFYCNHYRIGLTLGKIAKIEGPNPFDDQFEHTQVQIPGRNNLHVYYLTIIVRCGLCDRNHEFRVVLPQVKPNERF